MPPPHVHDPIRGNPPLSTWPAILSLEGDSP